MSLSHSSCSSHLQETSYVLSVVVGWLVHFTILYKWDHVVCAILCLTSLIWCNYFLYVSIIPFAKTVFHIPLYGFTTLCLFIHLLMNM